MATVADVNSKIEANYAELKAKVDGQIAEIADFVKSFWEDEEWANRVNWPNGGYSLPNVANIFNVSTLVSDINNSKVAAPVYKGEVSGSPTAFNTHQWSNAGFDRLVGYIDAALLSGGSAISKSFQDALFNSDRERRLQTLNDSLLAATSQFSVRGFRLPNAMLIAARNEIIQKYQFDDTNQSREIVKLMEEHMRVNWQFCVQQRITTEQFHADFAVKYADMFNQNIDRIIRAYEADVSAYINTLNADIKRVEAKLSVYKMGVDAQQVDNANEIAVAAQEIDLAFKRTSTITADRTNQAQAQLKGMEFIGTAYQQLASSFAQGSIQVNNIKTTA